MKRLLICMGEILIDFLPIEQGGRTVGFTMHPGGAPFNVAVGLSRLGQPTAFAGKVSTDMFGRYLRAYAEGEGIDTRFLLPADAPTTLAFVAVEGGEPVFAFYGEGAADTLLAPDEVPAALFDETAILHFGSISLLRGTTPSAVLSTARRLQGRALLSFDPNVRPGLVRDEAAYRALLDQLFSLADIVKLSAVDIAWLAPGQSVEQFAAGLLERQQGPVLVAVTRGGQGVLVRAGAQRWELPTFPVTIVDTVGAGDAFSAGLLAGLAEHGATSRTDVEQMQPETLAEVVRFAAATAALTCTRAGADPPRRAEVMQFLAGQAGQSSL